MKKNINFLFLIFLVFISSCSNDIDENSSLPQKPTNAINVSKQVSIDEAKAFVDKFAPSWIKSDASIKTRSSQDLLDYTIAPIKTKAGNLVMYSVNYSNNKGYILLSANKEDKTIIAISDSGKFDYSSVQDNPALNGWLEAKSETIEKSLVDNIDPSNQRYDLWNSIVNQQDTIIEIEVLYKDNKDDIQTRSHKNSNNLAWVNPSTSMYILWGQQSPYNYHAKIPGALVGCPAVAVGMLCYNYGYPTNSSWEYWNMWGTVTGSGDNDVAKMFRYIADQIPNYNWGKDASGATAGNILTGLKKLGYSDAQLVNYDLKTAHTNLVYGYPILLAGFAKYGGGHIWYCDGYKEITYTVRRKVVGVVVSTWTEYDDMLYMNWGWNGDSNGWYNENDFGGTYNYERKLYVNLYPPYSF